MLSQPLLPNCPICLCALSWKHIEPTEREPGKNAPYCKHCGWYGSDEEADDARRDRTHGTEMRLAYAFIVWVIVGSEMAWWGAPWWFPLVIVPVTLIPVVRFRHWKKTDAQREFYKRMTQESKDKQIRVRREQSSR